MKAVLHQDWACAPEGHTTRRYIVGEVLEGKAAAMAIADGVGFNPVEETKVEPQFETKKGRRK
jgi:hypothetical protein